MASNAITGAIIHICGLAHFQATVERDGRPGSEAVLCRGRRIGSLRPPRYDRVVAKDQDRHSVGPIPPPKGGSSVSPSLANPRQAIGVTATAPEAAEACGSAVTTAGCASDGIGA